MKNLVYYCIVFSFIQFGYSQVGIGTTNPDASSALEINADNAGVLFPRLTTAQRNAISNPATGLLIYNKTSGTFDYNTGTPTSPNWISIETSKQKSGTYNVGSTTTGWNYYNVTFTGKTFTTVPSITLTFREGTGINNSATYTMNHIKVANASTSGFTIAIYEESSSTDVFVDWVATPKTQ